MFECYGRMSVQKIVKEIGMKKKQIFMGLISVTLLMFGLIFIGCPTEETDPLNGTWVSGNKKLKLDNGTFELSYTTPTKPYTKGTYTTNGSNITMTTTHYHGINDNKFEEKWYTKTEAKTLLKTKVSSTDDEIDEMLDEDYFPVATGIYGTSLTITSGNITTTYTKQE